MALSSEFVALVQQEIPEGRQSLSDSHANLEKVAAYCIENFARADNKRMALEETKNYTTQSLASVAYQINTLAYNFLQMVEQQAHQLAEMESQVNYISQMVMIHKEKVARREIGVLTTNKTTGRQYKILAPSTTEKPIKYVRKPIDFTVMDEIGHDVQSSSSTPRSRRSASSNVGSAPLPHAPPPASAGPAPTTKPPTPPQPNRSVSSLSRGSREYRTPPVVAPPQLPSNYAPNYPIGHPRRNDRSSGYSTLPHPSAAQAPSPAASLNGAEMGQGMMRNSQSPYAQPPSQYGMAVPVMGMPGMVMSGMGMHEAPVYSTRHNMNMPMPPSPASSGVISEPDYGGHRESDYGHRSSGGASSPPLPPPPPHEVNAPFVPTNYLEKVIAVYDYSADKEDELTFSENAVIYVLKKNDDGWWEGMYQGITGLFPGNYVEPLM